MIREAIYKMFNLLILDIDGVMTDGTKTYGLDGQVLSKAFYDQDFTAIKRFKAKGLSVCFLSGDKRVNENICKHRKIDFFHPQKGKDKSEYLNFLCQTYNASPHNTAYVGDDIYDLQIMKNVKYAFCPSDAVSDVLEFCDTKGTILQSKGGCGVVKELYDYVCK